MRVPSALSLWPSQRLSTTTASHPCPTVRSRRLDNRLACDRDKQRPRQKSDGSTGSIKASPRSRGVALGEQISGEMSSSARVAAAKPTVTKSKKATCPQDRWPSASNRDAASRSAPLQEQQDNQKQRRPFGDSCTWPTRRSRPRKKIVTLSPIPFQPEHSAAPEGQHARARSMPRSKRKSGESWSLRVPAETFATGFAAEVRRSAHLEPSQPPCRRRHSDAFLASLCQKTSC